MAKQKFTNIVVRRHEDPEIMVPDKMDLKEAIKWLTKQVQQEEQEIAVDHTFDCFPTEGAVALWEAIQEVCGFSALESIETPFGAIHPKWTTVRTGLHEETQVPWGRIAAHGLDGFLSPGYVTTGSWPGTMKLGFRVTGKIIRRTEPVLQRVLLKTKEILQTRSIYRGKAWSLDLSWLRNQEEFDPREHAPRFIDVSNLPPLILNADAQQDLEAGIWTPIRKTATCRAHGIARKRGALFAGPFGTGKTLAASHTAAVCVENGWTYIYLNAVQDLAFALRLARWYQPCVVFAEDIDTAMAPTSNERSESVNAILNTLDGVDSKTVEMQVILTTNFLNSIEPALTRPGRLDTHIEFASPDVHTCEKLLSTFGGVDIAVDAELRPAAEHLAKAKANPAVVKEVVERARLYSLSHSEDITGSVTGEDLLTAARIVGRAIELMQPRARDARSDVEKAAETLGTAITGAFCPTT